MELRSAYLRTNRDWISLAPRSVRENRILVIQGNVEEVLFYRNLGWDAKALIFSMGVAGEFQDADQFEAVSPWQTSWGVDGMKFDFLVCNASANALLDHPDLVRRLFALLHPHGSLRLRLRNPEYYGTWIQRVGRELWPQPNDYPSSFGPGLKTLQSSLAEYGGVLVEVQEELDGMYHSPDMERWPTVTGWDCQVYLPRDSQQRKERFIKGWQVTLAPSAAKKTNLPSLDSQDLNSLHKEVESLLAEVKFEDAGLVLDKLFQSGTANSETCNLQGVLNFYRKDFASAWDNFRMAISLDSTRLDFYENLADAAGKADRVQETRELIARAQGKVPGVEGIAIDG